MKESPASFNKNTIIIYILQFEHPNYLVQNMLIYVCLEFSYIMVKRSAVTDLAPKLSADASRIYKNIWSL